MANSEQFYQHFNHQKYKGHFNLWRLLKICFFAFIVLIILMSVFSYKVTLSRESALNGLGRLPVIKQFRQLMGMENLKGELDNRINFLLLGQGGVGHEGPYLTDTIILGSIIPSTGNVALISIPRDLYVDIKSYGWHKINSANSIGEMNHYKNGGAGFAAKTIENIFDLPIHYWLRIDFNAFKEIINNLNGITVCVDRSFEDKNYPTENFKTEIIKFKAGCQKMDGATALKFARSRHGDNGEGSDFARSKRQQKILLAVKDKILTWKFLTNPNKLYKLYENIKQHIQTNITPAQFPDLINLIKNLNFASLKHYVIDDSAGGLLKPIITDAGAQVLIPKAGDLSELKDFVKNIFVVREIQQNKVPVIIINGTTVDGLATYIGYNLKSWGFNIQRLLTAPQQNFEKTVIYDLTHKQHLMALKMLKQRLKANTTEQLPDSLKTILTDNKKTAQFNGLIVVIGVDQQRAIKNIMEWKRRQAALQTIKEQKEKEKSSSTSPATLPENKTKE